MQWHTAFAVPLFTSNFDTVQTARRHDLDTLSAQTHCVLHRTLHGATELNTLFELLGDRVSDQLSVDFRLAHFFDVHCHWHAQASREFLLEVLDVFALLADHHTRTCRVNGDAGILGRTLDQNACHGSVLQLLFEVLTNLDVFGKHAGEITVACVPAACPVTADRQTEAGRMDFLSHILPLGLSYPRSHKCGR